MNNFGREALWTAADSTAWSEIDSAVLTEVGRIRVAQKVFPTIQMENAPYVTVDEFNPQTMTINEGQTRPFVEISLEFALTKSQVDNESNIHTARTLALLASKTVAQAEDEIFFQGRQAPLVVNNPIPGLLTFLNIDSAGDGLLGLVNANQVIPVVATGGSGSPPTGGYGSATFDAVAQGIALLIGLGHPGPFALFLSTAIYADTYQTVDFGQSTTAERIVPLVTGGFYTSGALPAALGLLVSLGGEPTTIYIAQDAVTAFTQQDALGAYRYRVFERVQIVNRDAQALVRLDFQ
jgi:uncharacterized linocin/CFP29 family protein